MRRGPTGPIAQYSLVLVEQAPLPPHERSWRHPSELGPTRADVESDHPGRLLALATGTVAVMAVALLVVSMTPSPGTAPVAINATTLPPFARSGPTAVAATTADATRDLARIASFTPIPDAIAASGVALTAAGTTTARALPEPHERVVVRTEAATYRMSWEDVAWFNLPDGAVVIDRSGAVVARVERGVLQLLPDD